MKPLLPLILLSMNSLLYSSTIQAISVTATTATPAYTLPDNITNAGDYYSSTDLSPNVTTSVNITGAASNNGWTLYARLNTSPTTPPVINLKLTQLGSFTGGGGTLNCGTVGSVIQLTSVPVQLCTFDAKKDVSNIQFSYQVTDYTNSSNNIAASGTHSWNIIFTVTEQ